MNISSLRQILPSMKLNQLQIKYVKICQHDTLINSHYANNHYQTIDYVYNIMNDTRMIIIILRWFSDAII